MDVYDKIEKTIEMKYALEILREVEKEIQESIDLSGYTYSTGLSCAKDIVRNKRVKLENKLNGLKCGWDIEYEDMKEEE